MGMPAGLKYVTDGILETQRHFLGLGISPSLLLGYEHMLITHLSADVSGRQVLSGSLLLGEGMAQGVWFSGRIVEHGLPC